MQPDARAMEIAGKFENSIAKNDKSLIEGISEEEIERTLTLYVREKGRQAFYDVMERRLRELKEARKEILSKKEREKERWRGRKETILIGIFVGVVAGVIVVIIQNHFFLQTK